MPVFLFRCPNTGLNVQGFATDGFEAAEASESAATYETLTCAACSQLHLIDPNSGRVLGGDES